MAQPQQEMYTLDEAIPFDDLADVLDKISKSDKTADKLRRLNSYMEHFRKVFLKTHGSLECNEESNHDSVFSIIRLFYPTADRKRASYNFKALALCKMFAKILGLDKTSPEGRKLLDYKDPLKSGPSDLGMVVYNIMQTRFSHQSSSKGGGGPKVSELHKVLDQLARGRTNKGAVTQDMQIKILQGFIRKLTPLEGKWLVRILLKDLMLGLNKQQILKAIHPKAPELINTMDLEAVCKMLNDPSVDLSSTDASSINLFSFFKPMMCTRLNEIDDGATKRQDASIDDDDDEDHVPKARRTKQKKANEPVKLPEPPFLLETKWDGERFQIHYERGAGNQEHKFKYFSRNGFDYTSAFEETLTPKLVALFSEDPPLRSFILDGEMMAWHKASKSFTQKGGNVDVKTLTPDSKHCPLFMAFDILYYNGETIHNKLLTERVEDMRQVLTPEESICQFSEQTLVQDKASVTDALNLAIDNLEEGLIVKTIDSVYHPGQRGTDWLKIKPEYIQGHAVEDLDLLILGAYYSDAGQRTSGKITNFLVGLVGDNKKEFYPLGTVGFGMLNNSERQELVRNINEISVANESPSTRHGRRKKPDIHIDPRRSVVLQVKASEIISSREYELGYSLRFPRITKTRYDKNWDDAMSVKEFNDLRQACDGKLAKKAGGGTGRPSWFKNRAKVAAQDKGDSSDEDSNQKVLANKSPTKKTGAVKSPVKSALSLLAAGSSTKPTSGFSLMGNAKKSAIFTNRVFCLIGADAWKAEVSNLLTAHGAKEIIPNPMLDCMCIIAEKESLRIKNYERNGSFDITNGRIWVDKCIEANRLLDFQPEDLFFAKESTRNSFTQDYDPYGDSYTKPCSLEEVKTLIQNMMKQQKEEPPMNPKELAALKRDLNEELLPLSPMKGSNKLSKLSKWSFLDGCKIAFRGAHANRESMIAELEFYGGRVTENETERGVTHIIIGDEDDGGGRKSKGSSSTFFVKGDWLIESLAKKELLPETKYLVL